MSVEQSYNNQSPSPSKCITRQNIEDFKVMYDDQNWKKTMCQLTVRLFYSKAITIIDLSVKIRDKVITVTEW
jgi:hypothetical protein